MQLVKCIHFNEAAGGPAREHPLSGASRVKGNFHARFLGGRGRVNRLRLPGAHSPIACKTLQKPRKRRRSKDWKGPTSKLATQRFASSSKMGNTNGVHETFMIPA